MNGQEQLLPTIQTGVRLSDLSTFRIGGLAKYYCAPASVSDFIQALSWASDRNVRFFILGGGSNVLFPDSGFDGLIIHPMLSHVTVHGTLVDVGATVPLATIIDVTLQVGLTGMEFAAGIPGFLGGAIRGNAGTFGESIGDVIRSVSILDIATMQEKIMDRNECLFSYRGSIFKEEQCAIFSARLSLQYGSTEESRKIINERIRVRKTSHPTDPSAGCIFKNIALNSSTMDAARTAGLNIDQFMKYKKIPTGFLVEQLGLKSKQIGGAKISPQHGNYIVNVGGARFEDVIKLVSHIKRQVSDVYGIQLEEEVEIVY